MPMSSRIRDVTQTTLDRIDARLVRSRRGTGPTPLVLPAELTDEGSRRPLPLPGGLERDALFAMLSSVAIDGAPAGELSAYVSEDFERFVHTWGMVRGACGRALEIGANPYFTTVLLREFTSLDLTLTNYFGRGAPGDEELQRVSYQRPNGSLESDAFPYVVVNVEGAPFPFDDETFDLVLFCEVIEHLLDDPVAALLEIRRVLRPDGRLVLSTPNVARLENVARLIAGANLYDPYSGHGPYGRHNREHTRHELHQLLAFCGFGQIDSFTADVHPHRASTFCALDDLAPRLEHRLEDLGQYIFVSAHRREVPVEDTRPTFLYRSLPPERLVDVL